MILTHAWPLSADIWDYQAVALSNAGYRVISYDRRVFGRSGKPSSGYDFDTFADDLAAVIRAMEFTLTREANASVRISGNCRLLASELPAVPAMATIVRPDTNVVSHSSFAAIGTWIEANKYEIAGPCREIFLEPITEPPGFERALVEI